jgi:hypothetical protein
MNQNEHALYLGKLIADFQSLEFALRAFLINNEIASGVSFPESINLNQLNVGDLVSENAFTNYDSLGQIIEKYNNLPKIISSGLTIDKTLIDIRDALAHGRISTDIPSTELKLLKFSRPKGKQVEVTFSVTMTKEWFSQQIKRVYEAVLKVHKAIEGLQDV